MAEKIYVQVNEDPIVLQYTKQGLQGETGATGPQGADAISWALLITMSDSPNGTCKMELYKDGELCREEQHYVHVQYMAPRASTFYVSDLWSQVFTGTHQFNYTNVRAIFATVYEDASMDKVLCENSVNHGKAATVSVGTVTKGTNASVTNSGTDLDAVFNFVLPKGDKGDTGDSGADFQYDANTETIIVRSTGTNLGGLAYLDSVSWSSITGKPTLGSLASLNSIDYDSNLITNKPTLGAVAQLDSIDFNDLTNKPIIGMMAALDTLSFNSLDDKPTIGALASQDSIDYESNLITNKPTLGALASLDEVDYDDLTNKPTLGTMAEEDDVPDDDKAYVRRSGFWEELFNIKDVLDAFSNEFSESQTYEAGDYVVYENALYKFTADHEAGEWDDTEAVYTTIADELKYLKSYIDNGGNVIDFGELATLDSIDYEDDDLITNKPTLGALASQDDVSWQSLTNKPTLGALASQDSLDYEGNLITNKPTLGDLAGLNDIDYEGEYITNKPTLGALSALDSIDYDSNLITNKPTFGDLAELNALSYDSELLTNKPSFGDMAEVDDAPSDNVPYARMNGEWFEISSGNGVDATTVAEEFSPTNDYAIGDYVIYFGRLYKFTSAHTGATWDSTEVTSVTADDFDATETYTVGDIVIYDEAYYIFTDEHTGEWNEDDAEEIGEFVASKQYSTDDYCVHDGDLYQFTSDHYSGAFDSTEVESTSVSDELDSKLSTSGGTMTGQLVFPVSANTQAGQLEFPLDDGKYVNVVVAKDSVSGNRVGTIRMWNEDGYNAIEIGAHDEANGSPKGITITNTAGTITTSMLGTVRFSADGYNTSSLAGYHADQYGCFTHLRATDTDTFNMKNYAGTAMFSVNWESGAITNATWNGNAVGVAYGGTGATTAANARTNLGVPSVTEANTFTSTQTVNNGSVIIKDSVADITAQSISENRNRYFGLYDKNGSYLAYTRLRQMASGASRVDISAIHSSGTNGLTMQISPAGVSSVSVTAPDAWRSAVGIPYTIATKAISGTTGATGYISMGITPAQGIPIALQIATTAATGTGLYAIFGSRTSNNTGAWYAKIIDSTANAAAVASTAVAGTLYYLVKDA